MTILDCFDDPARSVLTSQVSPRSHLATETATENICPGGTKRFRDRATAPLSCCLLRKYYAPVLLQELSKQKQLSNLQRIVDRCGCCTIQDLQHSLFNVFFEELIKYFVITRKTKNMETKHENTSSLAISKTYLDSRFVCKEVCKHTNRPCFNSLN